ncbi:MAG: RsmE family RNA methyltransferase [Actinomycetota bacterium]
MSAPHFFARAVAGDEVVIGGEDARHAARVLRIRPGEEITVADGAGSFVRARTVDVGPGAVRAEVLERRTVPRPHPRVTVFPAVCKHGKLEFVVQKLTELGVDRIAPWFAARSIVRWDPDKRRAHGDRLRAVAWEASKQSRRVWLPEIVDPAELPALPAVAVVLDEESSDRLGALLPVGEPDEIGVIIGPEGGLDREEVGTFRGLGALVAGLGPSILRTETAAIIGPALVLARYGRLG